MNNTSENAIIETQQLTQKEQIMSNRKSLPQKIYHGSKVYHLIESSIDEDGKIDAEWNTIESLSELTASFSLNASSVNQAYDLIERAGLTLGNMNRDIKEFYPVSVKKGDSVKFKGFSDKFNEIEFTVSDVKGDLVTLDPKYI